MPPVLPFLCLCLERLVIVWANGVGIHDGLGRDNDMDRYIGYGGRHCLGHGIDEAP